MNIPALAEVVGANIDNAHATLERLTREWDNENARGEVRRREELALEIAALAEEFAGYSDDLHRTWHNVFDLMRVASHINYDGLGEYIREKWTACANLLANTHSLCLQVEANLRRDPVTGRVAKAREDVLRMREEILDNWPWEPTAEQWECWTKEALAAKSTELDETFADAVGVSADEWRQRVEEHNRKYHSGNE